jgi:hypothetical protein
LIHLPPASQEASIVSPIGHVVEVQSKVRHSDRSFDISRQSMRIVFLHYAHGHTPSEADTLEHEM